MKEEGRIRFVSFAKLQKKFIPNLQFCTTFNNHDLNGFDRFFLFPGACGTIALIIFGAQGDGRDFMPDWEQNYLSWSFGLAFVGVVFMYIVAVLFIVEARIMQRKEIARESQEKQAYPMERTV